MKVHEKQSTNTSRNKGRTLGKRCQKHKTKQQIKELKAPGLNTIKANWGEVKRHRAIKKAR